MKTTNNSIAMWTKWAIGIIFLAAMVFFMVNNNSKNIAQNTIKIDRACSDVAGLEKDVFYIKERVDLIYKEVKEKK